MVGRGLTAIDLSGVEAVSFAAVCARFFPQATRRPNERTTTRLGKLN